MKSNLDVVYRDIDSSAALTFIINEKYEKLSRFSEELINSRVVLDTPGKQNGKAKLFRACIEMNIKGNQLAISQDDESVHIAVRDMFSAAERKLKSVSHKKRAHRHH